MQRLPYSVIQYIVEYAAYDNNRSKPCNNAYKPDKRTLGQLLSTCSSLRNAALERLNRHLRISQVNGKLDFSGLAYGTVKGEEIIEFKHCFSSIKTVNVTVDIYSLVSHDMLVNESNLFIRELVFANARTLNLDIVSTRKYEMKHIACFKDRDNVDIEQSDTVVTNKQEELEQKIRMGVSRFVSLVKDMQPNLKFFNLTMSKEQSRYRDMCQEKVNLVFELICHILNPLLAANSKTHNFNVYFPLSSLSIFWHEFENESKELVLRHKDTLQHLQMSFLLNEQGFSNFVTNERIIFPVLQSLYLEELEYVSLFAMGTTGLDPEYVPFPRLCKLTTAGRFLLTDKLFLHGNKKTLRLLDLYIDEMSLNTLANVFTGDRCQNSLVCFKFNQDMEWFTADMKRYIDDQKYKDLFRLLQSSLLSLRLHREPHIREDVNWDVFANFSSLRVIELPDFCIDLTTACTLLANVKYLKELGANGFKLGSRFSDIGFADVINVLKLESSPLNKHLTMLRVMESYSSYSYTQSTGKDTAMFVVALMQVCPNLSPLKVYQEYRMAVNMWYKILNRTVGCIEGGRQVDISQPSFRSIP